MFELNDKTALVTGATGGIGGGIARALHKQGATVAISGRQTDKLEKLAAELGSRTHVVPCDLGNKAQVAKLIDEAAAKLGGRLDILLRRELPDLGHRERTVAPFAPSRDDVLRATARSALSASPACCQEW